MIKHDPKNIWWFLQGYYRYFLRKTPLIRSYIKQQYEYRLENVNKDCLKQGSCIVCTCAVPALLMANKPCAKSKLDRSTLIMLFGNEKICYTNMLDKKSWLKFKKLMK